MPMSILGPQCLAEDISRDNMLQFGERIPDVRFLQCNAKWVLKQNWRSYISKRSQSRKGDFSSGSRTRRGATYCKGPFFTWQPQDGSHTHVGVHTGLYMDLIVLIKSLEDSVKVVETQLERIQNYNSTRVKDGRFLFGHNIVDEGRGGIFVLDTSSAQPHSAADFIVHQLAQMLECWCAHCRCSHVHAAGSHH